MHHQDGPTIMLLNTLLQDVVASATGEVFENYFNAVLRDKIGMDGAWFGTKQLQQCIF